MSRRVRAILSATAHGSTRLLRLFTPATLAALLGAALTAYGLYMVYPPLAFIVPGTALLAFGLWLAGLGVPHRDRREG